MTWNHGGRASSVGQLLGCPPSFEGQSIRPSCSNVERVVVDRQGMLKVHGWSVAYTEIVAVRIFKDNLLFGSAELGHARDDVAATFPAYPNASVSGFSFSGQSSAPHEVAIEAIRFGRLAGQGGCPNETGDNGESRSSRSARRWRLKQTLGLSSSPDMTLSSSARARSSLDTGTEVSYPSSFAKAISKTSGRVRLTDTTPRSKPQIFR